MNTGGKNYRFAFEYGKPM